MRESSLKLDKKRRIVTLAAIGLISIALWQTYWGSVLLYPFTILATWFHEMGHGLAAIIVGGSFEKLEIYANGSGLALSGRPPGALYGAFISAAGLLGPALAGAALILASRSKRACKIALSLLACLLLGSVVIWVRSWVGLCVLPLIALSLIAVLRNRHEELPVIAVQFLGVQAAISAFRDFNYIFSRGANIDGQLLPSDTQNIANALLLPHWFWGGIISMLILSLLIGSLRYALRD